MGSLYLYHLKLNRLLVFMVCENYKALPLGNF